MIIIKTRHLYFLQYLHDSLLHALFDNKEKSVVNIFFSIHMYLFCMTLQFPVKQSQYTLSNNNNCLTEDKILTLVPFTNFIFIFRVS